jgi:molecular chaperone IbpA
MSPFDFSPLLRSTIGFDRLMRLADAATRLDGAGASYPPYNIENTGEDAYRLTMAVAGFGAGDLEIVVQESVLVISGKAKKDEENARYLYRGIARRAFERRFQLADHIKVVGASLDNGLLHVELAREVPEGAKPRTIQIGTGAPEAKPKVIEEKQAA